MGRDLPRRHVDTVVNMPKVALYACYSTDNQNVVSIEDQFRICREYAGRERWQVVDTYHDGAISGASVTFRPGVRSLLQDAQRGRFDIVFAWRGWAPNAYSGPRVPGNPSHPLRERSTSSRFASTQQNYAWRRLNRLLQQNRHETDQQRCPQLGRYRGKADMAQVALFGRRMNSKRKMASAHACYWQGNNVRA